MKIDLARKDLEYLLKGTSPGYDEMTTPIISRLGKFTGGFLDKWDWNYTFDEDITDVQLWEAYVICRDGLSPDDKRDFRAKIHEDKADHKTLNESINELQDSIDSLKLSVRARIYLHWRKFKSIFK